MASEGNIWRVSVPRWGKRYKKGRGLDGHDIKESMEMLGRVVAYLLAAAIVSEPLPIRLREVNQLVIITQNWCSRPRPRLVACI